MSKNLFVADLFRSIQGEGKKLGVPSIFLRLGICNLQCTWCDTPYTWKNGFTDYTSRSQEWIIKKIHELRKGHHIQNLVVTGGEPLLQQEGLVELLEHSEFKDMEIEFETNGSMKLFPAMEKLVKQKDISFNISPKLADSGNRPYQVHLYPHSVLKFVYTSQKSEKLIDAFVKDHQKDFKNVPIYIMPEGFTVTALKKNTENILAYCYRKGYRFTPRLHILLFGNKRAT